MYRVIKLVRALDKARKEAVFIGRINNAPTAQLIFEIDSAIQEMEKELKAKLERKKPRGAR